MYILLLLFRNNIILIISLIINQQIIFLLLFICIYHLGLVKWMIWTRQWSKKPSIAVIKNPMMHLVKLESRQISSNRDISICFDSNTCICAILPLMFSLFCFCILETPNLRDSRVVVPNEEKRERSRSRPGSDGPALVCRRTQITPLLWGITMNSTRKIHSIYLLSLTASPHDISVRDSLSSTSPLGAAVFCLYSACMGHALRLQLSYFSKQTDHCQQECGLEDEIVWIEASWLPTQASRYARRSVTASGDTWSEAEAKQTQSLKDLSLRVCYTTE